MIRICILTLIAAVPATATAQSTLEEQLLAVPSAELASQARETGDAKRGAVVFYQPFMACRRCHAVSGESPLGPKLSGQRDGATDEFLVESLLKPSKVIRKGFETINVVTDEGKVFTGLLVKDTPESVVLREGRPDGKVITILKSDIDEQAKPQTSIMPAGQVNLLTSRQQFMDLVKYLIEVRDGGPLKAKELEPAPQLYQIRIPEYEKAIDHAGMIASLDQGAFKRGEAIYNRLCINCHGTHDRPGSLPTSLKFASGKFRNGSDPFTMYQTLTRGFGMMVAQTWMVPQQKYDVIHYVREAYLKSHNPTQLFEVTDKYLTGLPKGDSRGPKPRNIELWASMNYGHSLINTYEVGNNGSNFAYKGIATRVDPGPGGVSRGSAWMVFDHDTMRLAAAWTGKGFIDWAGIHFNGRHGIHPRLVGDVHLANPSGPGWANPDTGSFEDTRIVGRDGRRYGPLPREWAHYKGLYHHGQKRIIEYTVGSTHVLEMSALTETAKQPVFVRSFNIGPRDKAMTLQVAKRSDAGAVLTAFDRQNAVAFGAPVEAQPEDAPIDELTFNGRSYVEVASRDEFEVRDRDFTVTARIRTKSGGTILSKTMPGPKWTPGGRTIFVRGGRLTLDIGWVGAVMSRKRVNDGKWHDVAMRWEAKTRKVRLYVDGKEDAEGTLFDNQNHGQHVLRIGFTNPDFPRPRSFFDGDLQDVRFYQRQLSSEELAFESLPTDQALTGHWKLDAVKENKVVDSSGSKHDGIVRLGEPSSDVSVSTGSLVAGLQPPIEDAKWSSTKDGALLLTIPAGESKLSFSLWHSSAEPASDPSELASEVELGEPGIDLTQFTKGSAARWPERVLTEARLGESDGPFAVDVLTRPASNPWLAQVRLTGFDFYPDGDRAAASAWDGDVWLVSGLSGLNERSEAVPPKLTWQRIAAGLFQPLGVKIVDGQIFVTCRDQITILHDLNGDGETDFYENFNNDHQVTEHFHEFAMGLQTDDEGNFYYAKSARHALKAVVPHHGTLLRVSKDGSRTDILANGFRAANGVCLNPDGSFIVTDQEGHWNPKNRINWVRPNPDGTPRFYGNMFGYHDVTDSSNEAMEPPLCWITNSFDRSPAELLWVDSDRWGPLQGSLLNLSYGYGKIYVVPHEEVNGQMQGGMCALPLPQFPTGTIRGRFHSGDGQLYTCGMFAWAGSQHQPGGFYRIRYTNQPVHLPVGLQATKNGMRVTFSGRVDTEAAANVGNYRVKVWDLKRTASYGSKHYNERTLDVSEAKVALDGHSVELAIPDLKPTWGMEIRYLLKTSEGESFDGVIHNTVHHLPEE